MAVTPGTPDCDPAHWGKLESITDALQLASGVKPDVFCFCTLSNLRAEMVRIGINSGARLIAFEKPVALNCREGMAIRKTLAANGIKAVVSHQHRYGEHYRKEKAIIDSGALGRIHTVYGTATAWMMHNLSPLIDYMRWYNGNAGAQRVMAQAAGDGKMSNSHPSPDYIAGFIQFANDVRGIVECAAGAPDVPKVDYCGGSVASVLRVLTVSRKSSVQAAGAQLRKRALSPVAAA